MAAEENAGSPPTENDHQNGPQQQVERKQSYLEDAATTTQAPQCKKPTFHSKGQ